MLLDENDPAPVEIVRPDARSRFLLLGDHAGNAVPARLAGLGVAAAERTRHIGWDIGVARLGERLAEMLDAVFVRQRYSRLVIDCNRNLDAPDLIAPVSDGTVIAGNAGLSAADRAERIAAIHEPYQQAIAAEIAKRQAVGQASVLVALHSFTPTMAGRDRPWQIGVLHDGGDPRFALAFLAALRRESALTVGDNEPYRMDGTDHTVPRHAYADRLPYVEIEVRQDLLASDADIAAWADRIAAALRAASA